MNNTNSFIKKVLAKAKTAGNFTIDDIPLDIPELTDKLVKDNIDLNIWFDMSVIFLIPLKKQVDILRYEPIRKI